MGVWKQPDNRDFTAFFELELMNSVQNGGSKPLHSVNAGSAKVGIAKPATGMAMRQCSLRSCHIPMSEMATFLDSKRPLRNARPSGETLPIMGVDEVRYTETNHAKRGSFSPGFFQVLGHSVGCRSEPMVWDMTILGHTRFWRTDKNQRDLIFLERKSKTQRLSQ